MRDLATALRRAIRKRSGGSAGGAKRRRWTKRALPAALLCVVLFARQLARDASVAAAARGARRVSRVDVDAVQERLLQQFAL